MPKRLAISLLIIIILLSFIFYPVFSQKILGIYRNYKSSISGVNGIVTVYSDNGQVIGRYENYKMYIKYKNQGIIEIRTQDKIYIFSNATIIIEEN